MNVSSLSTASINAFMQYLSGKNGSSSTGLFASGESDSSSVDTTYLQEAAQGNALGTSERQAAVAELKDLTVSRLFDISA